ncbi:hypothetical protein [Saccharothrix texasensis]|uniref:Uncharacterized protein n=1 Tax=Saccharothrix texasensis TaxID=103734 RepID=A0A3N1H1D4_9PSEU|nr:hypothetical protein [Saccharothrix texasensis]ROP36289.1 hypothetical protein EDD40_1554 [Saccharothrix texasensis]
MDRQLHWLRFVQDGRAWDLDVHALWVDDTIALQELARGRTWAQILAGLDVGDMVAVKVMWWAARRANGETALRFEDVRFQWHTLAYSWVDDPTPVPEPPTAAEADPVSEAAPTTG